MGSSLSARVTRGLATVVAGVVLAAAAAPAALGQQLPGEPAPPSSADMRGLTTEEMAAFAKDWAQYGKQPDTAKLVDTTIAVISVAYPPAGVVLGVAKGIVVAASAGPDPVTEAINRINSELVQMNARMDGLQHQVDQLYDRSFRDENMARIRVLKARRDAIENIRFRLSQHPADPLMRSALAHDALMTANSFLDPGAEELDLWDWSDRLHVYTDPQNPGKLVGSLLPPRFKPMPTFEYYMSALGLAMVAIQYEANGDEALVRQKYGATLLRHASFLSVRPLWTDRNEAASFEHLPERLMQGITCTLQVVSTYPDRARQCTTKTICDDAFMPRTWVVNAQSYTLNTSDPNTLCSLPVYDRRRASDEEVAAARSPARIVYGEDAIRTLQDQQYRVDAQEGATESAWGLDAMTFLADSVARLAITGTLREALVGEFDKTTLTKEFIYGVARNGDLLWSAHYFGVDRSPPQPQLSERARTGASYAAAARAAASPAAAAAVSDRERADAAASVFANAGSATRHKATYGGAKSASPTPPMIHRWEGPKKVGNGWQDFVEVVPAWYGPLDGSGSRYGFSLYGLTRDGVLKWYRHDGFSDGTPAWRGAINVGTGWNGFTHLVAMGDGVVYGIARDGNLVWYRQADVADASAHPVWRGPTVVGNGWGDFLHVFGGGQGVIYAIKRDGTLLWYRHTGFGTGARTWEGPKVVGTGWQNFGTVFSPGNGIIYAVRPGGALMWYQHDGYADGTMRWQPPAQIATNWDQYLVVFPLMWGAPAVSVVR